MEMIEWIRKLDDFLKLSEKKLLANAGKISAEKASKKASKKPSGPQKSPQKSEKDSKNKEKRKETPLKAASSTKQNCERLNMEIEEREMQEEDSETEVSERSEEKSIKRLPLLLKTSLRSKVVQEDDAQLESEEEIETGEKDNVSVQKLNARLKQLLKKKQELLFQQQVVPDLKVQFSGKKRKAAELLESYDSAKKAKEKYLELHDEPLRKKIRANTLSVLEHDHPKYLKSTKSESILAITATKSKLILII